MEAPVSFTPLISQSPFRSIGALRAGWRPLPLNSISLPRSGPRRHCHPQNREGLVADPSELEVRSKRNSNAHAGLDHDDFLAFALLALHLSAACQEVPDFLNRPVRNRDRCRSRSEFEVGHAAAGQLQEDPHIGLVRGYGVASQGEAFGAKTAHTSPPEMIKGEWARLKNVIGPTGLTSASGHLFNPFQKLIEPAWRFRSQFVHQSRPRSESLALLFYAASDLIDLPDQPLHFLK
jgi:hypothetical protein